MKHHDCSCPVCKPCKPAPMQGILLPRIIASGRTWQRRSCVTLQVEGLPCCAQPPFALCSVSPCGEPCWEPLADGRSLRFRVTVPLLCQIRDACGCLHHGHAAISTEVCLTASCPIAECWRSHMTVLPCVRLVCADCTQDACFTAQLEVLVEAYLLRWEPCVTDRPCKPSCPELPLYPQPCRP
ncbi:MAG: hypothetical protein E7316_02765 [Clostridiales bacterium]|nr:hypothetical protein [Clostridiales bacterium]